MPRGKLGCVPEWHYQAACNDADPRLYFPPATGGQKNAQQAVAVCKTCPVIAECLASALHKEDFGIWGGTTANERRMMRRRARLSR